MSYQFAGFFAKPVLTAPAVLPEQAVWRVIETPFEGVGVALSSLQGAEICAEAVLALAYDLGFEAADAWLFLSYETWGGDIDFVYGLGRKGETSFGPIEEYEGSNT